VAWGKQAEAGDRMVSQNTNVTRNGRGTEPSF
jgi:hypothetical protein